jgi:hypothetical protein
MTRTVFPDGLPVGEATGAWLGAGGFAFQPHRPMWKLFSG